MKKTLKNIVYLIVFVISIICIICYFLPFFCSDIKTFCLSIGASGLASVVLAFLIEQANNKIQEQNKNEIRKNQLNRLDNQLKFTLERTVWYYYKINFKLFKSDNDTKCQKITYNELWKCLEEFAKRYDNLVLNDNLDIVNKNLIDKTTNIILNYYNHLLIYIKEINASIKIFECNGFFDNKDVQNLETVENFLYSLSSVDYIPVYELKSVFENLVKINEFKYLANSIFYYKNQEVAEKNDIKKIKEKFSEEDIKNAISQVMKGT